MELQFCSVVRITSWSTPSCHFVFRAQCATVITDRWDNNVWQSSLDSWHSNSRWQARTGYHRDNKCIRNGWKTNVARMSQSTTTKPAPSSCITRIPWRLFIYTRNANSPCRGGVLAKQVHYLEIERDTSTVIRISSLSFFNQIFVDFNE